MCFTLTLEISGIYILTESVRRSEFGSTEFYDLFTLNEIQIIALIKISTFKRKLFLRR